MFALDCEVQIHAIEREVAKSLQFYAQGLDAHETMGYMIASMARIYVLIHDCELERERQREIASELIVELQGDRFRSIRAVKPETFFSMQNPMPYGVGQTGHAHE